MAKYKHITFEMNFGTLPGSVLVCINNDWKDGLHRIKKYYSKKKRLGWVKALSTIEDDVKFWDERAAGTAHQETIEDVSYYFLFMKEFDARKPEQHKILAHECLHLCQFHLPNFFNVMTEHEFEAYTHSHLMQQFYDNAL